MASPTNLIQGITSATIAAVTPTSILRVRYSDSTRQASEGYDADTSNTQTYTEAANGYGSVEVRDPVQAAKLIGLQGDFTVVGKNAKAGGADVTHLFKNASFAQTGGEMQGGKNSPGMESINFIYGAHLINGLGIS